MNKFITALTLFTSFLFARQEAFSNQECSTFSNKFMDRTVF